MPPLPAVTRPWGAYEVLHAPRDGEAFLVKKIVVRPGRRLSLQSHEHRSEHWVVVQGRGLATLGSGGDALALGPMTHVFVPRGVRHRLQNTDAAEDLVVVEVQCGAPLVEEDIVRYEDDYARAP